MMEPVTGKITCELREGEEWWIVSNRAVEFMFFETLWRAHQWRRTTPLYAHYEAEAGIVYYMKEKEEWYSLTANRRGWRKAENQKWVEGEVEEWRNRILKTWRFWGCGEGSVAEGGKGEGKKEERDRQREEIMREL